MQIAELEQRVSQSLCAATIVPFLTWDLALESDEADARSYRVTARMILFADDGSIDSIKEQSIELVPDIARCTRDELEDFLVAVIERQRRLSRQRIERAMPDDLLCVGVLQRVAADQIGEVVGDERRLRDCRLARSWERDFAGLQPLDRDVTETLMRFFWPLEFVSDTDRSSYREFEERSGPCLVENDRDIGFMIQGQAGMTIAKRGNRAVVPYLRAFASSDPDSFAVDDLSGPGAVEVLIRQLETAT